MRTFLSFAYRPLDQSVSYLEAVMTLLTPLLASFHLYISFSHSFIHCNPFGHTNPLREKPQSRNLRLLQIDLKKRGVSFHSRP